MSALATRGPNPIASVGPDMDLATMGKVFAESGFFKDSRSAAQAMVKIMAGRELGIPPVTAMTGIYIVKDKVMVGATVLASAVQRSGRFSYRVAQIDDHGCKIEYFENGKLIGVSTFGPKEATAAGLSGNDNYKKHTRNMYFSRAMSNGVKWFCPGVLSGPVYTPEELNIPTNATGEPIVNEEGSPTTEVAGTRRSRVVDLIDPEPTVPPAPPPAPPAVPAIEPPPCGYGDGDKTDWRDFTIEAMVGRGFEKPRAAKVLDHLITQPPIGKGTYLSTTQEDRQALWESVQRGELDKHKAPKGAA